MKVGIDKLLESKMFETSQVGLMAWALSLGTDLGGNATPIGASANVVGTSVAAKGGYPISWLCGGNITSM